MLMEEDQSHYSFIQREMSRFINNQLELYTRNCDSVSTELKSIRWLVIFHLCLKNDTFWILPSHRFVVETIVCAYICIYIYIYIIWITKTPHEDHGFSNHPHTSTACSINSLYSQTKKHQSPALLVLVGWSTGISWIPSQRATNVESVSMWWRKM